MARKLAASFSPFSRKSVRVSHSDVSCLVSCQLIEHVFIIYKMYIKRNGVCAIYAFSLLAGFQRRINAGVIFSCDCLSTKMVRSVKCPTQELLSITILVRLIGAKPIVQVRR